MWYEKFDAVVGAVTRCELVADRASNTTNPTDLLSNMMPVFLASAVRERYDRWNKC
jgi:hypothetical protein